MSARLRAISDNLPQLKSSIEQLVTVISKECYTKSLINSEDYQSLQNIQTSRREKTKALLDYVWGSIRDDDRKCEQLFIQILAKYYRYQDLVSRIRGAQEDYENRSKVSQEKDSSRSMLLPTRFAPTQHQARPTQPSLCTESSTGTRTQTLGISTRAHPCSGHYNTKMEVEQLQARINEAQEENEKSKAEKIELQKESDVMKKHRSDLEKKLQGKDRELDEVVVERDNLRDSTEMLKKRISRLEKKHHADKKADKTLVDKRIVQDEERIRKLEKEKERLETDFTACDKKYQLMKERVYQLNGVIRRYEPIIENLKTDLKEQSTNRHRSVNYLYVVSCCIAIVVWSIIIIMLLYYVIL